MVTGSFPHRFSSPKRSLASSGAFWFGLKLSTMALKGWQY